jgi:hypothetical protein
MVIKVSNHSNQGNHGNHNYFKIIIPALKFTSTTSQFVGLYKFM